MERRAIALIGMFVFLLFSYSPLSQLEPVSNALPIAYPASRAIPADAAFANLAMKNPAAVYCTELGYEYQIVEYEDGSQNGVCHLPDGSTCSAWAFLEGRCGAEHSICARHELETVVRSDGGDPFSRKYAVCVDPTGRRVQSATEMADLMLKSTAGAQQLPSGIPLYGPQRPLRAPPAPSAVVAARAGVTGAVPPSAFDWRDHNGSNWMTPVKDQGVCGSCWAFGAVGALEAAINVDLGIPDVDLDLSEQYLVTDCAVDAGSCTGGWHSRAFFYIREFGIPDESCLPYRDGGPDGCTYIPECGSICTYSDAGACSDYRCSDRCATWSERLQRLEGYPSVGADKTEIKQALIEHGPLAVAVSTRGRFDPDGIYRCDDNESRNHIVVMVGYSDASGGYWILKNSHGTDYGEGGYYKMAYDTCAAQNHVYAVQTGLDAPGVTLAPPGQTGQGAKGAAVTYRPQVINHTGETQSFELSLSGHSWPSILSIQHTPLVADGESARFSVRVTIPEGVADGDTDSVMVTASSSDLAYRDASILSTEAVVPPEIEVSPTALDSLQPPGTTTTHTLDLHNPSTTKLLFSVHQALPSDAALLLSLNETGADRFFLDGSGQGNHGTCSRTSCPDSNAWSPRGWAAEFDGMNDRIVTPVDIDQSPSSPGATMMAWVRPSGTTTDIEVVISSDDGGLDWSIVRWGSTWNVYSGDSAPRTGFDVDLNQWQHVAAVFEPSEGRIRFYKNGNERVISGIGYDTSSNPIVLGDNAGPWENFFEGRIDEVQVYRRPLSAAEVRDIYRESDKAPWLSWDSPYGRVQGLDTRTIQFTLDATGLALGTYTAQGSVVSTDPDHSRVDVPVMMVVADQAPEISVQPASFDETLNQGTTLGRTLTISNSGTVALEFELSTVNPQVPWLAMDPISGTVSARGARAIQLTLDALEVELGAHHAQIRVESNDPLTPTLDIPLTMTVQEVVPEQFTIYLPIVMRE
jgi:C1A family cysteine protease/putative hemolysin